MTLKLLEEHRERLRKPFGQVLSPGEAAARARANPAFVVTVGDVSTAVMLEHGVTPRVAFIDFKTIRGPIPPSTAEVLSRFEAKVFKARNPAGTITGEALEACGKAFEHAAAGGRSLVVVEGEEDLMIIPAVLEAPEGALLFYGQPNEGLVLVLPTAENKRKTRETLEDAFQKEEK